VESCGNQHPDVQQTRGSDENERQLQDTLNNSFAVPVSTAPCARALHHLLPGLSAPTIFAPHKPNPAKRNPLLDQVL
jgi:hypothetical protein